MVDHANYSAWFYFVTDHLRPEREKYHLNIATRLNHADGGNQTCTASTVSVSAIHYSHGDLSIHIERVLCVMFLRPVIYWPITYWPQMGLVIARKLRMSLQIFMFSKMVQDYGNRSADICLVMQAIGEAGHSLSMRWLQSP